MNRTHRDDGSRRLPPKLPSILVRQVIAGLLLIPLLSLVGCAHPMNILRPAGPAASHIATLWWLMFAISVVVMLVVFGVMIAALIRRGRGIHEPHDDAGRPFILWGGAVVPAIIMLALMGYTVFVLRETTHQREAGPLELEVVGHQFWWEVRYPQYDFITANEIHIPVGERVRLNLLAADVIHSFWVPQLHGKMDTTPGHPAQTWLEASEPGTYRGQCAEFCGLQHANMAFLVIAHEPEDFAEWLERERQPAPDPTTASARRGQQVFVGSACAYCHRIRGTNATGEVGPDLTHFASRREIGAGTVPNTRGNLAGWIVDPHTAKYGNLMPPMPLEAQDLQALLDYMQTLR
jgi:cytochrome c oxidase subunit II